MKYLLTPYTLTFVLLALVGITIGLTTSVIAAPTSSGWDPCLAVNPTPVPETIPPESAFDCEKFERTRSGIVPPALPGDSLPTSGQYVGSAYGDFRLQMRCETGTVTTPRVNLSVTRWDLHGRSVNDIASNFSVYADFKALQIWKSILVQTVDNYISRNINANGGYGNYRNCTPRLIEQRVDMPYWRHFMGTFYVWNCNNNDCSGSSWSQQKNILSGEDNVIDLRTEENIEEDVSDELFLEDETTPTQTSTSDDNLVLELDGGEIKIVVPDDELLLEEDEDELLLLEDDTPTVSQVSSSQDAQDNNNGIVITTTTQPTTVPTEPTTDNDDPVIVLRYNQYDPSIVKNSRFPLQTSQVQQPVVTPTQQVVTPTQQPVQQPVVTESSWSSPHAHSSKKTITLPNGGSKTITTSTYINDRNERVTKTVERTVTNTWYYPQKQVVQAPLVVNPQNTFIFITTDTTPKK